MPTSTRHQKPTPAERLAAIRRLHGILRRPPDAPSFASAMAAVTPLQPSTFNNQRPPFK